MKTLLASFLITLTSATYAQEALIVRAPISTSPGGVAGSGTDLQQGSETEVIPTDKLDLLQFPSGSIISRAGKVGSFQTWELTTSSTAETMEAVFDSQGATSKELSELVMTERTETSTFNKAIVASGSAFVRYTLENGPIAKGDYITVSSEPGVGMRASESGFTIGVALEDSDKAEKPGLIKVRVMTRYERF